MTDGRWQVAGGRWQVAGGRWQVADDRWQMTDGRWQVAGGRWQVADDRWRDLAAPGLRPFPGANADLLITCRSIASRPPTSRIRSSHSRNGSRRPGMILVNRFSASQSPLRRASM